MPFELLGVLRNAAPSVPLVRMASSLLSFFSPLPETVGGTLYVIQGPLCGLLTETRRFAFCHAHLLCAFTIVQRHTNGPVSLRKIHQGSFCSPQLQFLFAVKPFKQTTFAVDCTRV